MAEKFGGKLIYGLGVFLTAVLTIISPFAAYWGLVPFAIVRVAEGITEVNLYYQILQKSLIENIDFIYTRYIHYRV